MQQLINAVIFRESFSPLSKSEQGAKKMFLAGERPRVAMDTVGEFKNNCRLVPEVRFQ
jgi:hypothetical protein